ncbi:MAG: hypothetical protein KY451_12045, partial [Actinobacteria bacterium]|nr:hypothetical protein [Actinomycetota bacterium]
ESSDTTMSGTQSGNESSDPAASTPRAAVTDSTFGGPTMAPADVEVQPAAQAGQFVMAVPVSSRVVAASALPFTGFDAWSVVVAIVAIPLGALLHFAGARPAMAR